MFNKKHLGKKSIILALPFFPVNIWKNSGQWALTVCPTVDEGQQLMLSHIPGHLPVRGNKEIPYSISQWHNTVKLLPTMKRWDTSLSSATPCNIPHEPSYRNKDPQWSEKQAGWDRAGPAETWIGQSGSWLLQSTPSKLPDLSHSCH